MTAAATPMRTAFAEFWRGLAMIAVANSGIALLFVASNEHGFLRNFIFSQCIGLSIYIAVKGLCDLRGRRRPGLAEAVIGVPLGAIVGFALGGWMNDVPLLAGEPRLLFMSGVAALLFGGIGSYFFYARARMAEAEAEARAEKLRRLEQETLSTQTDLRLLQAQIEPHFLFNTLSNVVGLIDSQPADAKAMLLNLTQLLRTSLARTRREAVTLEEELDLLRAYLGIMGIRMGARLHWRIDADPELLALLLPPLLVQPLVENAIQHGLEPCPAGGMLTIRCSRETGHLVVSVEDSGIGLNGLSGQGIGLANVRARLAARYGGGATLSLNANPAGGLTARLTIPLSDHAPADRR